MNNECFICNNDSIRKRKIHHLTIYNAIPAGMSDKDFVCIDCFNSLTKEADDKAAETVSTIFDKKRKFYAIFDARKNLGNDSDIRDMRGNKIGHIKRRVKVRGNKIITDHSRDLQVLTINEKLISSSKVYDIKKLPDDKKIGQIKKKGSFRKKWVVEDENKKSIFICKKISYGEYEIVDDNKDVVAYLTRNFKSLKQIGKEFGKDEALSWIGMVNPLLDIGINIANAKTKYLPYFIEIMDLTIDRMYILALLLTMEEKIRKQS